MANWGRKPDGRLKWQCCRAALGERHFSWCQVAVADTGPRGVYSCGRCGGRGHNQRTCSRPKREQPPGNWRGKWRVRKEPLTPPQRLPKHVRCAGCAQSFRGGIHVMEGGWKFGALLFHDLCFSPWLHSHNIHEVAA